MKFSPQNDRTEPTTNRFDCRAKNSWSDEKIKRSCGSDEAATRAGSLILRVLRLPLTSEALGLDDLGRG